LSKQNSYYQLISGARVCPEPFGRDLRGGGQQPEPVGDVPELGSTSTQAAARK